MKRVFVSTVVLCCTLFSLSTNAAERFILMKIGPTWPRVLLNEKRPIAGDALILTGITFDRKLSIGGGLDFLWNQSTDATKLNTNHFSVESVEKTLMFPLSGYLAISPISEFIIHPDFSTQIGFNTMYFSHKEKNDTIPKEDLTDENGWYLGFFWKIALDAVFDLSPSAALFAGIDYQWTKPKRAGEDNDFEFVQRDMSGIGIRMGFRAIF